MNARLIALLLLSSSGCALHERAVAMAREQKKLEAEERKKYPERLRCENASTIGSHMMGEDCVDVNNPPPVTGEPAAASIGLTGPQNAPAHHGG